MSAIKTVKERDALKPRHQPRWARIRKGCALGYRKVSAAGAGAWLARYTESGTAKQTIHSLGSFDHLPAGERYDAALGEAEKWFVHMGQGGRADGGTVKEVCAAYVRHLISQGRARTGEDAKGRYRRWVDADKLGKVEIQKLGKAAVTDWRTRLVGTKAKPQDRRKEATRARSAASVNRDMTALRAALNFALEQGMATTDAAWKVALKPIANANRRREIYLDRTQRAALIEKCPPDLANLIRGLSLLPIRPGALAGLKVANFERRTSTLTIPSDKAGAARALPLPASTAALLFELSRSKLPEAPLFSRADGGHWTKDAWKGPLKAAVTAAGLPQGATAYTLRHSVITDLVTGGLDLLTVAQLSGTSARMIEQHYGHLTRERASAALATLTL